MSRFSPVNRIFGSFGDQVVENGGMGSHELFLSKGILKPGPVFLQNKSLFFDLLDITKHYNLSNGFIAFFSRFLEERDFYKYATDRDVILSSMVFFKDSIISSNGEVFESEEGLLLFQTTFRAKISSLIPISIFCMENFAYSKISVENGFLSISIVYPEDKWFELEYLSKSYSFDYC